MVRIDKSNEVILKKINLKTDLKKTRIVNLILKMYGRKYLERL